MAESSPSTMSAEALFVHADHPPDSAEATVRYSRRLPVAKWKPAVGVLVGAVGLLLVFLACERERAGSLHRREARWLWGRFVGTEGLFLRSLLLLLLLGLFTAACSTNRCSFNVRVRYARSIIDHLWHCCSLTGSIPRQAVYSGTLTDVLTPGNYYSVYDILYILLHAGAVVVSLFLHTPTNYCCCCTRSYDTPMVTPLVAWTYFRSA